MIERASGNMPGLGGEKMDPVEYLAKIAEEENQSLVDEEQLKEQETGIMELGSKYKSEGNAQDLQKLIQMIRPFTKLLSKAKAAKLVRGLVDMYLDMDATTGYEVELCKECIQWAKEEKRLFLRQALEARLIALYHDTERYMDALALGSQLLKELKKLDDKNLLVEVQLLESKVYAALNNLPKARAALTSARTTANSIYVPPRVQAQLDLQSGILHASEEKDFKTAFSYFFEAFEQYDSVEDPMATMALKYMLLSKVMLNLPEEVTNLVSGKLALRHSGPGLEAMKAVALSAKNRSLADSQKALCNPSVLSENLRGFYSLQTGRLLSLPLALVQNASELTFQTLDWSLHLAGSTSPWTAACTSMPWWPWGPQHCRTARMPRRNMRRPS